MNPIALATSRYGPSAVMALCRVLPGGAVERLAGGLARSLAGRHDLAFVQALRANLAVVRGRAEDDAEVDQTLVALLHNTLVSYADFFRAVGDAPGAAPGACDLDPGAVRLLEACRAEGRGLVLVGAHMCSFDLLLLGLRDLCPSVQVLSNADPRGSSRVMNDIRRAQGLAVTPLSVASLRQAVQRLHEGGVVALAADLPLAGGEELTFFGRPARLPVGHARLALGTGARIVVGISHRSGPGCYRAEMAPCPRPRSVGDRRQDVVRWAQDSLALLEGMIGRWYREWLMPLPVWAG
ncbi:MAG: lysophospholipid acyltransferase family protein [Anaerolineae bacterium]